MKPFERATVPESEQYLVLEDLVRRWRRNHNDAGIVDAVGYTDDESKLRVMLWDYLMQVKSQSVVWMNDVYQVTVFDDVEVVHLSIKRRDRRPVHDWRDLQEIKNALVGPENEAVEIYPAESRKVDTANQYHLWAMKDPTFRFPVGFNVRWVTDESVGKSVNKPLEARDGTPND